MSIKIKTGNLLNAREKIIAHITNAKGILDIGVGQQIKKAYPKSYLQLQNLCSSNDLILGQTQVCFEENGKVICHVIAQGTPWKDTNIDKLRTAFEDLAFYAKTEGYSIAMPYRTGCSQEKADWNIVYQMIVEIFKDCNVVLYRLGVRY